MFINLPAKHTSDKIDIISSGDKITSFAKLSRVLISLAYFKFFVLKFFKAFQKELFINQDYIIRNRLVSMNNSTIYTVKQIGYKCKQYRKLEEFSGRKDSINLFSIVKCTRLFVV